MQKTQVPISTFIDAKSYYTILNGLCGVVLATSTCFYIFEAFAIDHLEQNIYDDYLAVGVSITKSESIFFNLINYHKTITF